MTTIPDTHSAGVDLIQGHRAETERLGQLVLFLEKFCPKIGQSADYANPVEISVAIEREREEAIIEAFAAVNRIAANSFNTA